MNEAYSVGFKNKIFELMLSKRNRGPESQVKCLRSSTLESKSIINKSRGAGPGFIHVRDKLLTRILGIFVGIIGRMEFGISGFHE
jgi:hypothetical protein